MQFFNIHGIVYKEVWNKSFNASVSSSFLATSSIDLDSTWNNMQDMCNVSMPVLRSAEGDIENLIYAL